MLTLLLVRHGQTVYNAENRYQGQRDIPLSEVGRDQALRLGARLAAAYADPDAPRLPGPPVAVYTSDLRRASETAALIVGLLGNRDDSDAVGPPIRPMPVLRERDFGAWEGLTRDEIRVRFAGETEPRDAEPWPDVWGRMNGALDGIYRAHVGQKATALIVGHGGSLRALLCHALGVGREHAQRFRLDNAGLSVIEVWGESAAEGLGRVALLNDTAHLSS